MKITYPTIFTIFVILIAMAVSGCTILNPGTPAATTTPGGATATPGGATASAPTATAVSPSGPSIDFDNLKVLEYKMSVTEEGETTSMNMRWEFQPAQIRMLMSSEGTVLFDTTVPRDQASGTQGSSSLGDAMDPDFSSRLTSVGIESVTVPKGTFSCTKYTITEGNAVSTYWLANNVPLPIKMTQEEDGKQTMAMELVDYQV
jgi:hypothetical protein